MILTKKVALVGRPNVGKSTLFNRLIGRKVALVHDQPGVTRDWREGEVSWGGDFSFTLVDTPGLDLPTDTPLKKAMWQQSWRAIEEASLVVFAVDGRTGISYGDTELAKVLHKSGKPILLVANKCEGDVFRNQLAEAFSLGFDAPLLISAEHGEGITDLLSAIFHHFNEQQKAHATSIEERTDKEDSFSSVRLAIVGRPNAGKSTLVNRLLGKERLLTGEQPGLTRDAIESQWEYEGQPFILVDTAGMRKRSKITDHIESLAVRESLRAIQYAQVVILVVDAQTPLESQDLHIARKVIDEGRCLVIALNKMDLITNPKSLLSFLRHKLECSFALVKEVPIVDISAKTGLHLKNLMKEINRVYALWQKRISTAELNRWLTEATTHHPPPQVAQRRLRLKYATQIKERPPTFALFANRAGEIPEAYLRYLSNSLRQTFALPAVPIRFILKGSQNPYKDKKSSS